MPILDATLSIGFLPHERHIVIERRYPGCEPERLEFESAARSIFFPWPVCRDHADDPGVLRIIEGEDLTVYAQPFGHQPCGCCGCDGTRVCASLRSAGTE